MIPYLIMIAMPGVFALSGARRAGVMFLAVAILYWLMIGFRLHVGMDWNNYLVLYNVQHHEDFAGLFQYYDIGYSLLDWIAGKIGGGYIFVNAVCALVFCWGFFSVARTCREPFLAVVVATPLLVVAFAMSGARQSIALGVIFFLFANWEKRSTLARIIFVVFAALFHSSAIFILIFVALAAKTSNVVRIGSVVAMTALILLFISYRPLAFEEYSARYVIAGVRKQDAPGAIVEVGIVAAAAIVYLLKRKEFGEIAGGGALYQNLAFAALAALAAIPFSSVGAYRFTLYFWPMAMCVWSGVPFLIESGTARALYRLLLVSASFAMLVGWLFLANNSLAWLPYDNWILHPDAGLFLRGLHGSLQ